MNERNVPVFIVLQVITFHLTVSNAGVEYVLAVRLPNSIQESEQLLELALISLPTMLWMLISVKIHLLWRHRKERLLGCLRTCIVCFWHLFLTPRRVNQRAFPSILARLISDYQNCFWSYKINIISYSKFNTRWWLWNIYHSQYYWVVYQEVSVIR